MGVKKKRRKYIYQKVARCSITGRFVTMAYARKHKRTTEIEMVRIEIIQKEV